MTSPLTETTPEPCPEVARDAAESEYARRLADRKAVLDRQTRLDRQVADIRLLVFLAGLGLLLAWIWHQWIAWWWALVPFATFVGLVIVHDRIRRSTRKMERAVAFYEKGVKRLNGTWPGSGTTGERFGAPEHPYAADLDLFGPASLFERLCTARTKAGEEALAGWLLAPAEPETIRDRQQAIAELRPGLDLREDLELIGSEVREGIDPEALATWGREPRMFFSRWPSVLAVLLSVGSIAAFYAWFGMGIGVSPLCLVIILIIGFSVWQKRRIERATSAVDERSHDLVLLAELLARLESEPFHSIALTKLRDALGSHRQPASRQVARLANLVGFIWLPPSSFSLRSRSFCCGPTTAPWPLMPGEHARGRRFPTGCGRSENSRPFARSQPIRTRIPTTPSPRSTKTRRDSTDRRLVIR